MKGLVTKIKEYNTGMITKIKYEGIGYEKKDEGIGYEN